MQSYSETLKTLHVLVLILQRIVRLFDDRFVGLLKLKSSVSAVAPKTNGNMAYGIHNGIKTSPLLVKTKLP